MKANELRIGNLVQIDGLKSPIPVSIIDTTETSIDTKAKPIPLTEEWLLKFGAIKSQHCWLINDKIELSHTTTEEYYEFEWQSPLLDWEIIAIKYVHELQNLYFALTGEELIYQKPE